MKTGRRYWRRTRRGAQSNAAKLKQPGAMASVLRWVARNSVHTTVPSDRWTS